MEIFSNAGLALKNKSQVLVILVVETQIHCAEGLCLCVNNEEEWGIT